MTRYACSSPGCPKRDPVTAMAAPTCYTCGGAMAAVWVPRMDPMSRHSASDLPHVFVHGKFQLGERGGQRPEETCDACGRDPRNSIHVTAIVDRPASAPRIDALYISLHAEIPGERDGQSTHELSYPGYARVAVARRSDGQLPEQVRLEFPSGTATCVARFFGIGLCASGRGELLYADEIHPHIYIDAVSSTTPILICSMRNIAALDALLAAQKARP